MQFIDRVKIRLKAGDGGDGLIAFRHEKYVPLAGPAGGDGGNGGSIYFEADSNKTTLLDLRYKKKIVAEDGEKGKTKNMYGKSADDVTVRVPLGTIIRDINTGKVLADLTKAGQKEVICKGGKGGKGNRHFATSKNSAPEHAELGTPGEEYEVEIELKLLADVGLVGLPSVGKSTLLSMISSARPEIADYPFTTLTPQLGVVKVDSSFSFVMADLPGLIEGASKGKGLGHDFLKHVERCRLLIHVLDMGHENPIEDFEIINNELKEYPGHLETRPMLVLANKMDEENAEEKLALFKEKYPDYKVFPSITLLGEGLQAMLYEVKNELPKIPLFPLYEENNESYKSFKFVPEQDFTITKAHDGSYLVISSKVEKVLGTVDLHTENDMLRFARTLRRIGIDDALRKAGCQDGDEVTIGDITFIFDEAEEDF